MFKFQQCFEKFEQHVNLRFSFLAAYGKRGQFVFYAGFLLRVKEEAIVKQQTQDQATA
jgi:hypothetical protein